MTTTLFPYEEVKIKIQSAEYITILSHLNPDADALGTALGIYSLLKKDKTKRVEVVNGSKALPFYLIIHAGYTIRNHINCFYISSNIFCI